MLDTHQHLLRPTRHDYFWLQPGSTIARDYALDDLRPQLGGVAATVLVQAAPSVSETEDLLEAAAVSGGLVRAVVGWVDLVAPAAPEAIAALAQRPLLKGVRPMLGFIDDTRWILQEKIQPALEALIGAGLRLDMPARPRHLPIIAELVQRHPRLPIVIDHAAKPAIVRGEFASWASDIALVARETGVFCKLSGLVTEASPGWNDEELRPYVEHLLWCFGAERLMWGSDWPVVDLAGSYARWRDTCLRLVPENHHASVMGATGRSFYGIDTDPKS